MSYKYRVTGKVSFSQVRSDNLLSLYYAMNYMQDSAIFHLESLGRGSTFFAENNLALFISAMQVDINEMPSMSTDIFIDTWAYGYDALSSYRNYQISGNNGKIYMNAYVAGAFIDLSSGKPIRITEEFMSSFPMGEKLEMDYLPRKIRVPDSWDTEGEPLLITKRHLDKNNHLNNARYISIAEEHLSEDFAIKRMRVEYKKPAKQNDIIIPKLKYTDSSCIALLQNQQGSTYAIAEFIK